MNDVRATPKWSQNNLTAICWWAAVLHKLQPTARISVVLGWSCHAHVCLCVSFSDWLYEAGWNVRFFRWALLVMAGWMCCTGGTLMSELCFQVVTAQPLAASVVTSIRLIFVQWERGSGPSSSFMSIVSINKKIPARKIAAVVKTAACQGVTIN